MVEVKVYNDIDSEKNGAWMEMFGTGEVFSAEKVRNLFDEHKEEMDFKFLINCDGGSVREGLAIYDIIRTAGKEKNIYTNIDGGCHSMATVILLAAPKENRSGNINLRALIHRVQGGIEGNADEVRQYADEIQEEEDAILAIYADRTSIDREILKKLMHEEKMLTAKELKKYGFISKINHYTTNFKINKMSKSKQDVLNSAESFFSKLKNLLSGSEPKNYDFTDADGNVLFSTESETDELEVGMPATPDGTFDLPDGRTVTIAEGVITEIVEPEGDSEEVEALNARVAELENALKESQSVITDLKNLVSSTHTVQNRTRVPGQKPNKTKTVDEMKNEMRENRSKYKGRK
ncbi:MAG: ATP-dependent Clp protease proteolytic subunit [Prevotellaceae bacterium]|nr:ATP-dependent Clp protease proteolytic subunit [Prevotellaceae bacterium]